MSRLEEIAQQIDQHKQPPVDRWKPEHEGVIDIRIDSLGFWFHEGGAIKREKLVQLFATILWHEDGQHFLVTPVEKLSIEVEDVPFVVHQMERLDDAWVAVTNTHDQVIISENNPVELRLYQEQWLPYIKVRYDLWARVNRSIYYQWVTEALQVQADDDKQLVLSSQGYQFEVARD